MKPAPKPKPAPAPAPVAVVGPQGSPVSAKLKIPKGPKWAVAREAMAELDRVHGDGPLYEIPLAASASRTFFGAIMHYPGRGATRMKLSSSGFREHPRMTLWHETGHWLDLMTLAKGGGVHPGLEARPMRKGGKLTIENVPKVAPPKAADGSAVASWSSQDRTNATMQQWRDAVINSKAIQEMHQWQSEAAQVPNPTGPGYVPNPRVPRWIDHGHLRYLLSANETFARSYAQYIAVRSGNAAGLAELRGYQADADAGRSLNHPDGRVPYRRQWQDDDFEPIGKAFDALFEAMGWRVTK